MTYQRQSPRHRVHLAVRYATAREFVEQYADNLSQKGLFIAGAHDLKPGEQVAVRLELPGYGETEVKAEVKHVIPPDQGDQGTQGGAPRKSGAGLSIVHAPLGFDAILESYLWRLGHRKDHTVMIADEAMSELLEGAGYLVERVPAPSVIKDAVAKAKKPVIAIVVRKPHIPYYARALQGAPAASLVRALEDFADFDALLTGVDEELFKRLRQLQRERRQGH